MEWYPIPSFFAPLFSFPPLLFLSSFLFPASSASTMSEPMSNTNEAHHESNSGHINGNAANSKHNYDHDRFNQLERVVTAHGHALQTSQPAFPSDKIHRRLALPIPLAAYSIGATTYLLGLLLLKAHHTTLPNAWIINGLPMGAWLTLLAGVGEIFTGNTFGCALFLSVGGLVLGLAQPFLPWSGVAAAFIVANSTNPELALQQINGATGIFVMIAFAILFLLLIASQRTAVAFVTSLVLINIVLITFGIGLMTGNQSCVTTAGAFLIMVSFNLFYNGTALLMLEVGHPLAKFMPLGSLAPAPPKEHSA